MWSWWPFKNTCYFRHWISIFKKKEVNITWCIELREPITPWYGSISVFSPSLVIKRGVQMILILYINLWHKTIEVQLFCQNGITGWSRKGNYIFLFGVSNPLLYSCFILLTCLTKAQLTFSLDTHMCFTRSTIHWLVKKPFFVLVLAINAFVLALPLLSSQILCFSLTSFNN